MSPPTIENFGRNVRFTPAAYAEPANEAEVLELLDRHRQQSIRVLASGHAWSDAIRTDGLLLNVRHLNDVRIDPQARRVRVGAGCQLKRLIALLDAQGWTLPSLGLIDEQTVAGATATGTHGSGKHCLSQYIQSVRLAHRDAETGEPRVTEIDSGAELEAARCSLGLLGVILEIEFEIRPAYRVLEQVRRHATLESVLAQETEDPLQQFFFIPWSWHLLGQHRRETSRPRSLLAGLYRGYWHLGIDWGLHLIICLLARVIRRAGLIRFFYRGVLPWVVIRGWQVVDDSHRMLTMQHELFRHIEIELFVLRSDLPEALQRVRQEIERAGDRQTLQPGEATYCHHYPICVRRVLADETMLSMASPRPPGSTEDWYAISLICYDRPRQREGFYRFAQQVTDALRGALGARCHWGKYNPLDRKSNEALYPRIEEFRRVVRRFDRRGEFANAWLREVLLAPEEDQDALD